LPPQGLIGLGLPVLVERGGYVLGGCAGAGEGVIKAGVFFRGAHEQRRRFRQAVAAFVGDLRNGHFRAGLREARGLADSRT
jgi:hypothetical protein